MVYARRTIWTAADLAALPRDEYDYELVKGRLIQIAPPTVGHDEIGRSLHMALRVYADAHGGQAYGADRGFNLTLADETEETVLRPAAAYARDETVATDDHGYIRRAPDLAVEVVSLNQFRPAIMREKARLWLSRGCRLVWIVWPDRKRIEVWRDGDARTAHIARASDDLDGADVLPGFHHAVADIFSDI